MKDMGNIKDIQQSFSIIEKGRSKEDRKKSMLPQIEAQTPGPLCAFKKLCEDTNS